MENAVENQKKKIESFMKGIRIWSFSVQIFAGIRDRLDELEDLKKSRKSLNEEILKLKKDLNLATKVQCQSSKDLSKTHT